MPAPRKLGRVLDAEHDVVSTDEIEVAQKRLIERGCRYLIHGQTDDCIEWLSRFACRWRARVGERNALFKRHCYGGRHGFSLPFDGPCATGWYNYAKARVAPDAT